jgi:hypothetical protein
MFSEMADEECPLRSVAERQGQDVGKREAARTICAPLSPTSNIPSERFATVTVISTHIARVRIGQLQMKIILDHLDTLAPCADVDRGRLEHDDIQRAKCNTCDPRLLASV